MHIGPVGEQLNAHAGAEGRGQRLVFEFAAGDGLSRLAEQERERVLHLTDLSFQVHGLCLHAVVVGLCALHACAACASQVHLQFHHLPSVLGELGHIVDNGHLAVEHEQGVVHIGHSADYIGLDHHTVVFHAEERHLCAAFLREQVSEEVYAPAGRDGQLIGLGGLIAVPRGDGARGREGKGGHEGQFGGHELCLYHLHVESGIEQVGIVVECRFYEVLQLRVGEDTAPGQVAEAGGVYRHEGIGERYIVAYEPLGIDIGALIFIVQAASRHQK